MAYDLLTNEFRISLAQGAMVTLVCLAIVSCTAYERKLYTDREIVKTMCEKKGSSDGP